MFSRGGRSREDKDSRADDCADAEGSQRPRPQRFLKPMPRLVGFRNQFVDRLTAEKLVIR